MGLSKEQWNEEAEAAQKLCEAFLIAWGALKNGDTVPGNVAASMGEVGGSGSTFDPQAAFTAPAQAKGLENYVGL